MSGLTAAPRSSWFARRILPGFAFKALVIGGGYATGRELAEFFLPSGPWGGVLGMAIAAAIWSIVCALTFLLALLSDSFDYRHFFRQLLGRFWVVYEVAFLASLTISLAVFGAAAGAVGTALFAWPPLAGTLLLVAGIAVIAAFGSASVEALFKWVSFLLYGVYAVFLVLALARFGDRIAAAFAAPVVGPGWLAAGITYAGYNVVGAASILPTIRHLRTPRDAVLGGLIAGPLAMVPAVMFYLSMAAWPQLKDVTLPSDFLLRQLGVPTFRLLFQVMIFFALLECGTGTVHAFNERIAGTLAENRLGPRRRLAISLALLAFAVFLAAQIGLVGLIGRGYRYLSYAIIATYVVPLMTVGTVQIHRRLPAFQRGAQTASDVA